MSYAATVALDLDNADYDDYQTVYEHLEGIGLSRKVKGTNDHTLPETTLYGKFENYQSAGSLRDFISEEADKAYKLAGVSGKVFITVGGTDHTWGIRSPKHGT